MSSDEGHVVLPRMWQFLLNNESSNDKKREIWTHEINKKRLENDTILNFLAELREDELKLKNNKLNIPQSKKNSPSNQRCVSIRIRWRRSISFTNKLNETFSKKKFNK